MYNRPNQSGMVLLVCLILLLLLTLIGVSAMRSASFQEKMAGNLGFTNASFQTAEMALREGEDFIVKKELDSSTCGICKDNTCQPPAVTFPVTEGVATGTNLCGVWTKAGDGAYYYIQNLGVSSSAKITGSTVTSVNLFRVTGAGTASASNSVVESIFAYKH